MSKQRMCRPKNTDVTLHQATASSSLEHVHENTYCGAKHVLDALSMASGLLHPESARMRFCR
jgi:hypothetical protein